MKDYVCEPGLDIDWPVISYHATTTTRLIAATAFQARTMMIVGMTVNGIVRLFCLPAMSQQVLRSCRQIACICGPKVESIGSGVAI